MRVHQDQAFVSLIFYKDNIKATFFPLPSNIARIEGLLQRIKIYKDPYSFSTLPSRAVLLRSGFAPLPDFLIQLIDLFFQQTRKDDTNHKDNRDEQKKKR